MLEFSVKKLHKNLTIFGATIYFLMSANASAAEDVTVELSQPDDLSAKYYPAGISVKPDANSSSSNISLRPDVDSSNSNIFREIERSLIFSQQSTRNADFYRQPDDSDKKSDITINAGNGIDKGVSKDKDGNSNSGSPTIGIIVVNPKTSDLNIREKERLAYNSSAIDQYEVSIALYKEVLAAEPNNSYAKFSLAVIYQKLGQFRQAKSLYYQLLKSSPEMYQEVITNLLTILIEESPKEATYMLSRLAIENPQSAYIAAQAAIAYDRTKEYSKAILMMRKATNLDSENLLYRYDLAVMYDKSDKSKEASELYNSVVRDYSTENDEQQNIPIEQIKNRIKSIKNK